MKSSKEKIDEMLGIQDNQSIDDYLDSLNMNVDQISATFGQIEDSVKQSVSDIDSEIAKMNSDQNSILTIQNLDLSLKEIEDLIGLSKQIFKHIYDSITTTDLIDSELVHSCASMLESIHLNLAEFISIYKDKQKYIDKIKLMIFQQQQKKELMELKHRHDMEKLAMTGGKSDEKGAIDVEGNVKYDQNEIIKMLKNMD